VALTATATFGGAVEPEVKDRFYPPWFRVARGTIIVPQAAGGSTYRVALDGGTNSLTALLLADAGIVFHVPLGQPVDFQNHAGQYFAGGRVFTRTTADTVRVRYGHRVPYAIRDANTWELLYRTPLPVPETAEHRLGKNRQIAVIVRARADIMTFVSGVSPYLSTTCEGWFDPER